MKIYPLHFTSVDWKTYIKACQKAFGQSPTRNLDKVNYDINKAPAFLASLNIDKSPNANLRQRGQFFLHVTAGFLIVDNQNLLIWTSLNTNLKIHLIYKDEEAWTFILSGNMLDWYEAVVIGCNSRIMKSRKLMNQIYDFFVDAGFQEIWYDYKKVINYDNQMFKLTRG